MFPHVSFTPDADIMSRTRWYVKFRWFYILLVTVPTGLAMYAVSGVRKELVIVVLAGVLALMLNGLFYLVSRLLRTIFQHQILAAVIPLADIVIITCSIAFLGTIGEEGSLLYSIPIIMSAATLGRKGAYAAGVMSLISYNTIFIGDLSRVGSPEAMYTIIFQNASLVAILLAVDYILRLLRQKERQALRTVGDLMRAQEVGKFGSWETNVQSGDGIWSDQVYRLLGLDPKTDDLTYDRFMGFIHAEDRRHVKAAARRVYSRPKRFHLNYRVITAAGELRFVHAEGESLLGESGKVETVTGILRDTTEEQQLDQSKNEFVALASHQLRTPATVIKQYLFMLLDGYAGELTDKQRDFLKTASDTNDRQIAIVNNLLDVARLESGKIRLRFTTIDVIGLLASLVKEYQPQAEAKQQTISFHPRYKHLECQADEYHLRTVLENIVDNALRYSLPHTGITIRVMAHPTAVLIAIIDKGIGIDANDISKLFKKFSRIEHPATFHEEGAGLGLYWSDKVVRLHGGHIEAQSVLGKGSTFTVVLPRKAPASKRKRKIGA